MSGDLLGPLRDGPVPPLAPAAAVRARGQQRTRRRRAVLVGAAAVVVLAAGVTLAGPAGDDELRPAPFATEAPAPGDRLHAALLDPEDVAQVLGGSSWDDLPDESPFSVPLTGCPATAAPFEPGAARFLTDGDRIVGQALSLHPDDAAADARFQREMASLRACGESSPTYRLFDSGGQARSRVFGEVLDAGEPARPFSFERVGRVLVTLVLQGPPEPSPELADAAAGEVRETRLPAAPPPSPTSLAPDRPVSALLLTAEDAARAEPGAWRVSDQDGADPKLLDPCTGGTSYSRDADRVDRAATAMGTVREAGGTSLTQTVARYPDAASAREAAKDYERAVRACPKEEGGEELPGSNRSHEVVEEYSELHGVRTLYVRSEGGCETCSPSYTYYAVQQVDDLVSVLRTTVGEDGDPGVGLVRPFAERVAQRLTR